MNKTVIKQDGTSTWFNSPAADKSPTGGLTPVDSEMGAGALNARRALQQFSGGEFHSGGNVPLIGWDFGHSNATGKINSYAFNKQLEQGSFVSITLAFDRVITFGNEANNNGSFDSMDMFNTSSDTIVPGHDQFSDLDLYLLPKSSNSLSDAIALSETGSSTIEHIFFQIPATDQYKFWVRQRNANAGQVDYSVAWWALGTGPAITMLGDWNFDEQITSDDINSMLNALTDLTTYKNQWGLDDDDLIALGDTNGDGVVNNKDIQPELDLVENAGAGAVSAAPEPASIVLLLLAIPAFAMYRRRDGDSLARPQMS